MVARRPQRATVTRSRRVQLHGHKAGILCFTGLSGAGKSTIANAVEEQLHQQGYRTFVPDGDNIRDGLCSDLGFLNEDRHENIRRIGETTKLFADAGAMVLVAAISPPRDHVQNSVAIIVTEACKLRSLTA